MILAPLLILKLKFLKKKLKNLFRKPKDITNTWIKTPHMMHSNINFHNWFNATDSIETTLKTGKRDWDYRLKSISFPLLKQYNRACEIGFGSGRLLQWSCKDFEKVYGVDIHESFLRTSTFLKAQNTNNFELIHFDKREKIPNQSIDFFYSFIVFQHFSKIDVVKDYLVFIKKKKSKKGIAHIYYAKYPGKGYHEIDEKSFSNNESTLYINPNYMKTLVNEAGLLVVSECLSVYKDIHKKNKKSIQVYMILK